MSRADSRDLLTVKSEMGVVNCSHVHLVTALAGAPASCAHPPNLVGRQT